MRVEHAMAILLLLLQGACVTILLVALSSSLGFVFIALPLGLCRLSRRKLLRWISGAYDFIFRGIPLIVLLYIVYYGLSAWPPVRNTSLWLLFREPYFCALLALSLNTGAYGAEIVQGALRSVPAGVREAGTALGLSKWQRLVLVESPIALRYALAPYLHEVIALTKATAAVSTITILDLMGTASSLYAETFDAFTPYLAAAAIYVAMILAITRIGLLAERRLYRDEGDRLPRSSLSQPKGPVA
jgi:His/Glu/Gln/Arg/opine family amino acid ABC transporter permease subunit